MSLLYEKRSSGTIDEVGQRLEQAIPAHKFGLIGLIDMKEKMASKGVEFAPECRVYEVCNPVQAKKILDHDMRISSALPCRISVYEKDGSVVLSTLLPSAMIGMFECPEIVPVAKEVEVAIKAMMDEAAG